MFKVNDKVIHSREGLSTIVSVTTLGGNEYFVIHSDKGGGENIYVLVNNTGTLIRPIMSAEEARELIAYMKTIKAEFISNTKQRRDIYKRKLLSGDVHDLAFLSKQLYFYNYYIRTGEPVRLGPTDLQLLKDAEQILMDEFSLSFRIDRDKTFDYVYGMIIG